MRTAQATTELLGLDRKTQLLFFYVGFILIYTQFVKLHPELKAIVYQQSYVAL